MKCVIMAGGKGTRISSLVSDIPKPMIPIEGVPLLEREILSLRDQGITEFILTVSHLSEVIIEHFHDGKELGVHISYFEEKTPLGNAGALFQMKEELTEDFLLINGDVLFDIDVNRFIAFHKEKNALVSLFTHPNDHPYDSGLIITDDDGRVISWLAKEDERPLYYQNRVNAGLHIISPVVLERTIDKEKIDLDRDVLKPLCNGRMYAYDSSEYVKDMGTPERYEMVCRDFRNGKIAARSLRNRQKAIFLDRDGTINHFVGFLRKIDEMDLNPHAAEAIRKINASEYLCIVITNQPAIARGEVTFAELKEIHNKLETLLGNEGAYLDGLFFCPHHPDKGYEGEIPELKIDCDCRKPKPGMFFQARDTYNIDLSKSYMIGDSDNDVLAGSHAGCKCIKIERDGDLLEAVNKILGE